MRGGFWFAVVLVVVSMSDSGARSSELGVVAGFPLLAFTVAAWPLLACVSHALAEIVFLRLVGARHIPPRVAALTERGSIRMRSPP